MITLTRKQSNAPQGSSLFSIMFNLLLSDLGKEPKYRTFHKYADDFKFYPSGALPSPTEFLRMIQTDNQKLTSIRHF